MANQKKTNHQIGYRKPQKNPTHNFTGVIGKHDFYSHRAFCERCKKYNGKCPRTGTDRPDDKCTA